MMAYTVENYTLKNPSQPQNSTYCDQSKLFELQFCNFDRALAAVRRIKPKQKIIHFRFWGSFKQLLWQQLFQKLEA